MAFCVAAEPLAAQTSTLFPLDRFWTHALDAPFAAPPAADARHVYVALVTGELAAYAPGRGDPVWTVELAADGVMVAAGGRLFVPAGGAIHALDAATGAVQWRLPAGPLAAPLSWRAGWLVVPLADGALQAMRASDGVVVWARAMGAPVAAVPSIDGDLLVAGFADGRIAAMDVTTGASRWERSLGSGVTGVTVSGDRIFAGTADGHFWSLRARNGDLDWRWRIGSTLVGAPAADDARVYIVARDNVVRGFNRGSGHTRWTFPLPTRPLAGPIVVDGVVVITSGDVGRPGLTYVDARTGAAAGRTPPVPPDLLSATAAAAGDSQAAHETARTQYPALVAGGTRPYALLATASTAGDWRLHAFTQTFLTATTGPIAWGKRYDVRRRLAFRVGAVAWGERVTLSRPPG